MTTTLTTVTARAALAEAIFAALAGMSDFAALFPGGFTHGMPGTPPIDRTGSAYGTFLFTDAFGIEAEDNGAEVIETVPVLFNAYALADATRGGDAVVDEMIESVISRIIGLATGFGGQRWAVSYAQLAGRVGPEEDPEKTEAGAVVWHAAALIEFKVTVSR